MAGTPFAPIGKPPRQPIVTPCAIFSLRTQHAGSTPMVYPMRLMCHRTVGRSIISISRVRALMRYSLIYLETTRATSRCTRHSRFFPHAQASLPCRVGQARPLLSAGGRDRIQARHAACGHPIFRYRALRAGNPRRANCVGDEGVFVPTAALSPVGAEGNRAKLRGREVKSI